PEVGIVLGSGLGNFLSEIKVMARVKYTDIPHFPSSTVEGHAGELVFGEIKQRPIVVMSGRFHYYEGYETTDVVYPIRVMKMLGIRTLLVSNAAGGVNTDFKVGDLMVLTDHISFSVKNPLIGQNSDFLGPRFPDMSEPYSRKLVDQLKMIAQDQNIVLREGIYYGVTGPSFETRAEYRMIRLLGADAVGM